MSEVAQNHWFQLSKQTMKVAEADRGEFGSGAFGGALQWQLTFQLHLLTEVGPSSWGCPELFGPFNAKEMQAPVSTGLYLNQVYQDQSICESKLKTSAQATRLI